MQFLGFADTVDKVLIGENNNRRLAGISQVEGMAAQAKASSGDRRGPE